jgi:hypothetical protein
MDDAQLEERIAKAVEERIAPLLEAILQRQVFLQDRLALTVVKETYTIEETAGRLGRSDWTIRQWCNHGQVNGAKKVHGKGRTGEWRIPHDEVVRLQNEGPLSPGTFDKGGRAHRNVS